MQEIKTTLAELDALREKATKGKWFVEPCGTEANIASLSEDVEYVVAISDIYACKKVDAEAIVALHNAYPAIRAYIEKLERELLATQNALMERNNELIGARQVAEAGRVLAEAVEKMDAMIGLPPMYEPREMGAFKNGWNTNDEKWSKQRDAALSAYHSATRDITSKEKEV